MGKSVKHSTVKVSGAKASQDILTVIVDHHQVLREAIKVLKQDEATESQKRKHLEKFIPWLRMHAHAEQEVLYDAIREIESLKHHVFEGLEEHDIADALTVQLESLDYRNNWNDEISSKAKVLAELVEHHIDEEEDEFFPEIRRCTIPVELEFLRDEYLAQCEQYLERMPVPFMTTLVKSAFTSVTKYVNNKMT